MFVRFSTFALESNSDPEPGRAFASAVADVIRIQPGFQSVVFFGDAFEQYSVSVWETRDQAEDAGRAVAAWLEDGNWTAYAELRTTPMTRIMEGFIPTAVKERMPAG